MLWLIIASDSCFQSAYKWIVMIWQAAKKWRDCLWSELDRRVLDKQFICARSMAFHQPPVFRGGLKSLMCSQEGQPEASRCAAHHWGRWGFLVEHSNAEVEPRWADGGSALKGLVLPRPHSKRCEELQCFWKRWSLSLWSGVRILQCSVVFCFPAVTMETQRKQI